MQFKVGVIYAPSLSDKFLSISICKSLQLFKEQ